MEPIVKERVQELLDKFVDQPVYIHLETTNGAYASHFDNEGYNVGAYARNVNVTFVRAQIVGDGKSFRIGLKLPIGWIYAEGLTDWTIFEDNKLLLAGHDREGRLMVSLQISKEPFTY